MYGCFGYMSFLRKVIIVEGWTLSSFVVGFIIQNMKKNNVLRIYLHVDRQIRVNDRASQLSKKT